MHNCKCIHLHCSGHDSWYTPFDLLCKIRQVFTGNQIDLDPCSDPIAQQTVQAMTYFTKKSDGLSKDWFGRVFVNPPFGLLGGKSQQGMFASKALEEYNQKRASEVILLLKASVGYGWFNTVMEHPHGFLRSRVAFTCPQRASELTPNEGCGSTLHVSNPHGSVVVYLGKNVDCFCRTFTSRSVAFIPGFNSWAKVDP